MHRGTGSEQPSRRQLEDPTTSIPISVAESLTCSTRNLPCMAAFGSSIQLTRVSGSSSSSNSRWLQSLSQVSLARYTGTCQVAGLPGPVLGVFWGWGGSEICGRSCQLASFPTCSPRATKPAGLQELARWRAEEKPSLWDGNGERWQRRRAGEAPGGGGTAVRRKRGGSSSPGGYGAGETGGSRSGERGRGAPGGRRTRESERAGPRGRRGGYGYGYEYPRGGDDDDDYKRMKGDKEQQLAWGGLEGGVESLLSWAAYVKEMLQAVPWSWPMLLMGLPLVLGLTHPSWLMLVPLPLMLFPSLRESLQEALAPVSKAFAPLKETLAPIGEALPPALSETWRNLQGLSHRAARETCRPPSASPSPSSRSPYPPPLAPSHSSHSPTPSTSSATSYSPSPSPSSSYPYPLASSRSFSEAPPRGPRSPPSDDLYSPSGGRGTTPGSTARSSAPGGLYGPQDAGSATAGELYMPLEPPPSRPPTGRRASVDTGLPLPAHRGDQQKPPRGTLGGQIWSLPRGRAPPPQQSESTGQGFYEDAPPVRPTEQSMGAGFGSELTSGQVFEYQRMFEYLAREEQEGPKGQGFEFQGFERQGIEAQGTWANPASQGFREPTSGQGLRAPPGGEGVRVPRQAEVGDRKREGFRPRPLPRAWGAPEGERYREGMPSAEASRSGGEGAGWRSGSGSASDFDSSSRSDPGSASASGYGSASASASASGFGSGSGYGSRFVSASASGSGYDSGYGSASGSGSYYTRGEGGGNGDGSIGVGAFDGEVYDSSRRWSVRAASTAGPLGAAAAGSVSRVPSGAGSMPSGTAGGMRDSVQRAPPLSFPDGRHQAAVDGAVEYSRSVPADGDLLGGRRAAQPQPLRHLGLPEVGQGVASWHRWEGGVASAERGEYVAKMSVSRRQLAQERRQQSRGLPKEGRLNSAPALDRGRVSAARSSSSAGGGDTSTGSTSSNSSRGGSSSSSSSGGGGRRGGQSQERGEAGEAGEAQEAQEEQEDWFYKPEFLQEPAGKSRLATPGRGGQGQGQVQGQGQGRRKRAVGGGDGGREGNSGESRVEFDTEGGGGGEEWFYRPEFLRKSAGGEGRGERTPGNASERP
eukprot:jgi/Mesen1/10605/ME000086S10144